MTTNLLFAFCIMSLLANTVLAWLLFSRKRQKQLTVDAQELLKDLMKGGALLHIVRIAPEDVLLRSPRR